MRFNLHCDTQIEAEEYLRNRAIQLLKFDVMFDGVEYVDGAVIGYFKKKYSTPDTEDLFMSIYILESYRGKGLFDKYYNEYNLPIITSTECQLEPFLKANDYKYIIYKIENTIEYKLIQSFYGDSKAKRSGVYYMNHIDEGLAILEWINSSKDAKLAYCLHPIFQMDSDLLNANNFADFKVSHSTIIRAMEYRSVANEYLSHRNVSSIYEIRLSPLKDVNDMLIADKIQNFKDFQLYHDGKHPRSYELNKYFNDWLYVLGISQSQYQEFKNKLSTTIK